MPAGTCKLWDDKPCFMPNAKPNVKRSPRRSLHKSKGKAQAPRPTFGLCSPLRGDKPWVWFFEKGPKRTLFMPLPPKQMQRCHPVGAYTSRTARHGLLARLLACVGPYGMTSPGLGSLKKGLNAPFSCPCRRNKCNAVTPQGPTQAEGQGTGSSPDVWLV